MIINIIAGSPFNINLIKKFPADITIGVDYGAYRLVENGIKVDYAFGDFDSISTDQYKILANSIKHINKYKSEKDSSDSELALDYAISLNPNVINLFGATGKRIDHFLSVLNLYKKLFGKNSNLYIYDDYNKIYLKTTGTHKIFKSEYKYISFFAYDGEVKNLTLRNFKYELTNHLLKNEDTLSISNEIINEGIISFDSGKLLIVESKD